ncbi:MAG: EAL domain-containing protein [Gammaproteobacteria bacterium]|nr:EAL domain-containing protein [Gammaproteobacteria bacterium]
MPNSEKAPAARPLTEPSERVTRQQKIRAEQIHILYRHAPGIYLASLLVIGGITYMFWDAVPRAHLASWTEIITAVTLTRLLLVWMYRRAAPTPERAGPWGILSALGSGVAGILWGSTAIFLYVPNSILHQTFLLLCIAGMMAGAVSSLISYMPAFRAYYLAVSLPFVVRLATQMSLSTSSGHVTDTLAVLFVAFSVMLYFFARSSHNTVLESLRLRFENSDLARELLARKEHVERVNEELQIEISEREKAEEYLRLAANALENTADGVTITDAERRIVFINKAFSIITGHTLEEVSNKTPERVLTDRPETSAHAAIENALRETGCWRGEISARRKNGEIYPALLSISAVRDVMGSVTHYVGVFNDISTYKQFEERMKFLAHHDALTQLPNRVMLQGRFRETANRAERYEKQAALLFIDLDRFKTINDSLGHSVGDLLLQSVAVRLSEGVRKIDTVVRLGGDEFVILLDDLPEIQDAASIAQKLLDVLARPFMLAGHKLYVSGSIGISCYPRDGTDLEALLRNADAAMYRAKDLGRNTYQFFSNEMNVRAFETLVLANSLHAALERKEFLLEYQPRVDLRTGKITGVEALIRWQHPELGVLAPAQFVSLAEETGLISAIGEWALRTACLQARAWSVSGHGPLRMAVNLSARQFSQPDILQRIITVLDETGLEPPSLEIEITESMMMGDTETTEKVLNELSALGVMITIDDFGTSYSSLSSLKHFPIDYLKIDQFFVRDVPNDLDDVAIVRAIIAMAKSLKLRVIAEGIETQAQHEFFTEEACEEGQGYYFSRPMNARAISALLKENLSLAG